jgi:hypothetical protein
VLDTGLVHRHGGVGCGAGVLGAAEPPVIPSQARSSVTGESVRISPELIESRPATTTATAAAFPR